MDYEGDDFLDGLNPDDWLVFFNTSTYDLEATDNDATIDISDRIFRGIQQYLPPIQVFLSGFGNIFAIVIMARLKNKMHQLCTYLIIVAVADFAIIMWLSGNEWLMQMVGRDYKTDNMNNSDICCKVLTYFDHLFMHLSVWTTVTVCIENVFFHLRPGNIRHFNSKRVTDVMCLLMVLVMCFNLHYFWTYGVIAVEIDFAIGHVIHDNYCFFLTKTLKGTKHQTDGFIWKALDMVLVDYVPVVIVTVTLVLICLARSGKIQVKVLDDGQPRDEDLLDSKAFSDLRSKTLLILGCALPLTFLPSMVIQLLDKEASIKMWSQVGAITKEWKMLFFSCKFYVYLASSLRVRQELRLILSPIWKKGRNLYLRVRAALERCWFRPRREQATGRHIEQIEEWEAVV